VRDWLLAGWKPGPRDPDKKTSPYLLGWEELEQEIKGYDRDAVMAVPDILAMPGFETYRLRE
jgi:hypothetical protein